MDFTQVFPGLLMGWNQWFYFATIIGLLLAVISFGYPYVSFWGVDQMRLQRFFGRLTPYAFIALVLVMLVFIFESVYSAVVWFLLGQAGTNDITQINGTAAYVFAFVISSIFVGLSVRWLRKQWRESDLDKLPPSDSTRLKTVIGRLNSKLDKLDKLDKIDTLVQHLEEYVKHTQQSNPKKR